MESYLGIEIGGTKLQLVAGDASGAIITRRKFAIEPAAGAAGIRGQIEEALPGLIHESLPRVVGVGFGGPVDWQNGRICRSHHIEGWSEFELGEWLNQVTGAEVAVDNDGNVAALGEARRGAGKGRNPVFYVTLGSGVGGGLVVDGKIYHGASPGEAELGHVRLERNGVTVESRCSGWAVDKRIRTLQIEQPSSLLSQLSHQQPGAEARHLRPAFEQGDPAARRLLQEIAEDLAFGLSHVVHLFHPEIVIIGGGLAAVGEPLRGAVEKALTGFTMEAFKPGPLVALSQLGEDAVPVGALQLAKEWFAGSGNTAR